MFLGIQKNSRGAEGKHKKTPDPFTVAGSYQFLKLPNRLPHQNMLVLFYSLDLDPAEER